MTIKYIRYEAPHACYAYRVLEGTRYDEITHKIIMKYKCSKCGKTWEE